MKHQENGLTTQPVNVNGSSSMLPEFGRCADVRHLFGLKRGTLYNLLAQGKIRGVKLRVNGHVSGVRLFDLASVREFILSEMQSNNTKIDSEASQD